MDCNCEKAPEFPTKAFIPGPIEIPINFRAVTIPADQGDDVANPPQNGAYRNVVLKYAANGHTYIYSSDGIPVMLVGSITFSSLPDRPKYDGQPMTSYTDIPDLTDEVSTLQSQIQALATDFSYKGSVEDYAHLPADAATGDVYTTTDTGVIYVWDGNAWVALNDTPDVFTGATSDTAGTEGLVPAPQTTDIGKFLSGDGTWKDTTTFLPFPSSVNTTGTTQQFMSSILALTPPVGTAYLGTVSLSDLPASLVQEEVEVYVYNAYTIYCILRSADTDPYMWWCSSYQYAGWRPIGATVVQTTGTSTSNVMSQDATTNMLWRDPSTKKTLQYVTWEQSSYHGNDLNNIYIGADMIARDNSGGNVIIGHKTRSIGPFGKTVMIGDNISTLGSDLISIGYENDPLGHQKGDSSVSIGNFIGNVPGASVLIGSGRTGAGEANPPTAASGSSVVIGNNASAASSGGVAIGRFAGSTRRGEFSIGLQNTVDVYHTNAWGYNRSNFRLLSGVYTPGDDYDAANKAYVDANTPTNFTTNEWNALWA